MSWFTVALLYPSNTVSEGAVELNRAAKSASGAKWYFVGILLGDLGGVVGEAVVPEEEDEVWVGLGEDRFDRACEVISAVVDGEDEAIFHLSHPKPICRSCNRK